MEINDEIKTSIAETIPNALERIVHSIKINDRLSTSASMVQLEPTAPRMVLNPDKEIVDRIINRIYLNNGNCPCQVAEVGKDTKCPCPDFLEHRKCHCSLFVEAVD